MTTKIICPVCPYSNLFASPNALEHHLAAVHFKCFPYECVDCRGEQRFTTPQKLELHMKDDHGLNEFKIDLRVAFKPTNEERFKLNQIAGQILSIKKVPHDGATPSDIDQGTDSSNTAPTANTNGGGPTGFLTSTTRHSTSRETSESSHPNPASDDAISLTDFSTPALSPLRGVSNSSSGRSLSAKSSPSPLVKRQLVKRAYTMESRVKAGRGRRYDPQSARAGLQMPVGKIRRHLRQPKVHVNTSAAVYLGGVLDYLTTEVLELAGNASHEDEETRINPSHIRLAIKGDTELSALTNTVIVPDSAIVMETGALQTCTRQCGECNEMVKDKKESLLHHINKEHLKLPFHSCTICGRTFTDYAPTYLAICRHVRNDHGVGKQDNWKIFTELNAEVKAEIENSLANFFPAQQ